MALSPWLGKNLTIVLSVWVAIHVDAWNRAVRYTWLSGFSSLKAAERRQIVRITAWSTQSMAFCSNVVVSDECLIQATLKRANSVPIASSARKAVVHIPRD